MAKKGGAAPERGAKTRAIKEYLAANPSASPKVVVDALAAQGIQVSVGLVSVTKYKKPKGAAPVVAKRGRKPASATTGSIDDAFDLIRCANKVGGVDAAIALLNKLSQM